MGDIKKEITEMLNRALELEHAARIQYLAHAELIKGLEAEPLIARLKEIASDELKHEEIFRELIGSYMGGTPTMGMAKTFEAGETKEILGVNLKGEKDAIDFYKQIYQKVKDNKKEFPYEFEALEHQIRHVILDEEEHVTELSTLLGK
ncbi:MAG: ferritin-like domain-containing protein [Candidatus Omnitrophica bacterium]|jgi:bacterioferritin (cytochrome b1)|nr:ferritin-like domain-containing protein [Candidatus Omnitrophota bacterium]MDD5725001.1 ferritin-like domain-containing protein [Candidatus Omnitrophota bacterium]